MVSGPASKPAALNFSRSTMIRSMVSAGMADGTRCGRRERGSNAASPSDRYRASSSKSHDGETPYQWAVNMARTYRRMRMLTLVGGVHGTFGLGQSDCVDTNIAAFLLSATPPPIDLTCPYSPPTSRR